MFEHRFNRYIDKNIYFLRSYISLFKISYARIQMHRPHKSIASRIKFTRIVYYTVYMIYIYIYYTLKVTARYIQTIQ